MYARGYDFPLPWIERVHPFDPRRARRALGLIRADLPDVRVLRPGRPVGREALRLVHDQDYLDGLRNRHRMTSIIEVDVPKIVPAHVIDRAVLRPMRWATSGTILAVEHVLQTGGGVINLSGGFHHASPDHGHGFCAYADAAIGVASARKGGRLAPADRVVHIDLDAHMGNGIARCFFDDRSVFLFDMYNGSVFPDDPGAAERIDCALPLRPLTNWREYRTLLEERLAPFLDSAGRNAPVRLAVFNGGTDVLWNDALGGIALQLDEVLERDQIVLGELNRRSIPWVMLPSGGYSRWSARLIAATASWAIETRAAHG